MSLAQAAGGKQSPVSGLQGKFKKISLAQAAGGKQSPVSCLQGKCLKITPGQACCLQGKFLKISPAQAAGGKRNPVSRLKDICLKITPQGLLVCYLQSRFSFVKTPDVCREDISICFLLSLMEGKTWSAKV